MNKHLLGYVSLPVGLTAVLGGIHLSHDSSVIGALTIVIGVALVLVAFRALRAPTAGRTDGPAPPAEDATSKATGPEPHTPPPR